MQVDPNYGVSCNDPVPLDDNEEVQVPDVQYQTNEDHGQEMLEVLNLDPITDDGNYGINR